MPQINKDMAKQTNLILEQFNKLNDKPGEAREAMEKHWIKVMTEAQGANDLLTVFIIAEALSVYYEKTPNSALKIGPQLGVEFTNSKKVCDIFVETLASSGAYNTANQLKHSQNVISSQIDVATKNILSDDAMKANRAAIPDSGETGHDAAPNKEKDKAIKASLLKMAEENKDILKNFTLEYKEIEMNKDACKTALEKGITEKSQPIYEEIFYTIDDKSPTADPPLVHWINVMQQALENKDLLTAMIINEAISNALNAYQFSIDNEKINIPKSSRAIFENSTQTIQNNGTEWRTALAEEHIVIKSLEQEKLHEPEATAAKIKEQNSLAEKAAWQAAQQAEISRVNALQQPAAAVTAQNANNASSAINVQPEPTSTEKNPGVREESTINKQKTPELKTKKENPFMAALGNMFTKHKPLTPLEIKALDSKKIKPADTPPIPRDGHAPRRK